MALRHVAAYIRVSTEEQARDNTSLENQAAKILAYAAEHDLGLVCVYADPGWSGATDQRPAFQALLAAVRAGEVARILVYRQDRFSRSPRHLYNALSDLEAHTCSFTSVTEAYADTSTPMGRQFVHTLAGFAQWELDTFRERSRDGKLRILEQQRHPGGAPPFGYRIEKPEGSGKGRIAGVLVPDQREAQIVVQMFQWAAEGATCPQIAARLDAMQLYPRRSKWRGRESSGQWDPSTVATRLRDTAYIGEWRFGKRARAKNRPMVDEPQVVAIPALVDRETFRRVGEQLDQHRLWAKRNARRSYLLRGLIHCATCGRPYIGSAHKVRRSQPDVLYYGAHTGHAYRNQPQCRHPHVRCEFAEAKVWGEIQAYLDDPASWRALLEAQVGHTRPELAGEIAAAEKRLGELRQAELNVMLAYADPANAVSQDVFQEAVRRFSQQRQAVEGLLAELHSQQMDADTRRQRLDEAEAELRAFREDLQSPTWEKQRRAVERFVRDVLVGVSDDGRPTLRARYAFEKRASGVGAIAPLSLWRQQGNQYTPLEIETVFGPARFSGKDSLRRA